jgi:carboxyl-terminal processing protease
MKKIYWAACGLALALLSSCGGGGEPTAFAAGYPGAITGCGAVNEKAWLRAYMNDQYYWYDKQGQPNDSATTPAQYLDSLVYKPTDHYSFVQSTASYIQLFNEGERLGWGYSTAWADAAKTVLRFSIIEPLGPLALAGVQRGDQVISIDNFTPQAIVGGALTPPTSEASPRTFVVRNAAGVERTILLAAKLFKLSPVLTSKVLSVSSPSGTSTSTVGYLAYNEFIDAGNPALGMAFNDFAAKGVNELVLDMRYNGGGRVTVSRDLASMIGGTRLNGRLFADFRYNAKNSASNTPVNFRSSGLPGAPLNGLKRLIVISSEDTASASELIVNSLRPYMEVVLIGDTTYGKPYGSQPRDACNTTYAVIVTESFNAQGQGGYSDGIAATCKVPEDLSLPFGDPQEGRLSAALSYIQTSACPVVAAANKPIASSSAAKASAREAKSKGSFGEGSPLGAILD